MSVFLSSQSASPVEIAKPMASDSVSGSSRSERPICIHHKGEVTVVVYSAPNQEPKRLNQALLPSLHILLVEEGKEIAGLAAILADYLSTTTADSGASAELANDPVVCATTK